MNILSKKDKKQKGERVDRHIKAMEHRVGTITKIIKLDYIAEITCWCGKIVTIDSSKPVTENRCPGCNSPYKLLPSEWTQDEMNKIIADDNLNSLADKGNKILDEALDVTKKIEDEMKI